MKPSTTKFSEIKNMILDMTKQEKTESGMVMPVGYIINGRNMIAVPIVFYDPIEKQDSYFNFGKKAATMGISNYLICVADAAGRHWESEDERKYIFENIETESPLSYPENMRLNMVMLFGIRFRRDMNKTSIFSVMQNYTKNGKDLIWGKRDEIITPMNKVNWEECYLFSLVMQGFIEGIKERQL